MKKQVLVSVDRGETRVALLEATGTARRRQAPAAGAARARPPPTAGYRVAELYFERRGNRSIVGNIYKGKVDNVLPGLEAAFVDIGLDKNGFLHVDEIVLPGVEVARRGRGREGGKKISDLLKPGQEIVVQVVKDPLKTKGARLSMDLTIAGRYMVYTPTGEGVGVSKRLDDKERERLRRETKGARPAGRRRDRPHRGPRRQARRTSSASCSTSSSSTRSCRSASPRPPRPGWSSRRPTSRCASCATSSRADFERALVDDEKQYHRLVSFFTRTAPELVDRVELYQDSTPLFEAYGVEEVIEGLISRRVDLPSRRLPDDRLRRGADGHRRQLGLVRRARQAGAPGGHDHADEPRGRRGGRQPAAPARHRRHHRHRLHRHGAGAQPRRRAQDAAQVARRGPHEDLHRGDLASSAWSR